MSQTVSLYHECNVNACNVPTMCLIDEIKSSSSAISENMIYFMPFYICRCHTENMAGVGRDCGRVRRSAKSCLAQGRIDAYRSRSKGCNYQKGLTNGVLCCRKPTKTDCRSFLCQFAFANTNIIK